jgi:Tfp pilus assembly protein PilX
MTRPRPRHPRSGIIYLLVLGTAAIIAVLTLGGLLVLRSQRKSATSETDATEARLYAQSALEIGMQIVS